MFAFSQIEPNTIGTKSTWDVPVNTWMGLKFDAARESTMGRSIEKMSEDFWDEGEMLSPEEANKRFSVAGEGGLQFKEPVKAGRAALMKERKLAELERLSYFEAASHSWASGKAIAGFGAALVGSMSHPLDFGITFIPLFGQEAKAAQIAKLGGGAFRQRMAKGLIATEDDLVRAGVPMPRVTASVIEGMVGNAIAEIPVFIQNSRDQAIYGLEDSFINVLAGGAFAGAIRGVGRALEKAADLYFRLDDRVKAEIEADAMKSFLNDQQINVDRIVRVDEAAIRDRVKFDEASVVAGAEQKPTAELQGWEPRAWSELTPEQQQAAEGLILAHSRPGYLTLPDAINATEWHVNTKTGEVRFGAVADSVVTVSVNGGRAMEPIREQAINDYVEAKRTEWNEEERFQQGVKREITRQQNEGKILSDDEVERMTFKDQPSDTETSALAEDVATITKDIEASERPLTEAEAKSLKEIPEMNEQTFQAAMPCVLEALRGGN